MTLTEYLTTNQIAPTDFAQQIGVTREAVLMWMSAARTPRPKMMERIKKATAGSVTPNDFQTPEPVAAE
jgi:DNA-binding transcriptional regulator YdaS (Cro superfamily)